MDNVKCSDVVFLAASLVMALLVAGVYLVHARSARRMLRTRHTTAIVGWLAMLVFFFGLQYAFRACGDGILERFFYSRLFSYVLAGVVLVAYSRFYKLLALAVFYAVLVVYNHYLLQGNSDLQVYRFWLGPMIGVLLLEVISRLRRGWPLGRSDFP